MVLRRIEIVTMEDPIEYMHEHDGCIITSARWPCATLPWPAP